MSTTGNGTIGERIRECRKDLGLSQEALAEVLYMKKSTISKYESNNRDIPASIIVSLSEALDTSPNYLLLGFDGTDMEEKWIEDIVQVLKKITEPPYRELALNQLKCIVNMVA